MLPGLTLPASLLEMLAVLRPCFTAPGFVTFCGLVAGWPGGCGAVPWRACCWAAACSICGRMTALAVQRRCHPGSGRRPPGGSGNRARPRSAAATAAAVPVITALRRKPAQGLPARRRLRSRCIRRTGWTCRRRTPGRPRSTRGSGGRRGRARSTPGARRSTLLGRRWQLFSRRVGQLLPESLLAR
jgi:hypothetical protein